MWSRDLSAPSKGSVFQLFTDELPRNILACDRVRMHAVPVILDHGLLIGISPDPQCLWVSFGVSGAGLSDVRPSGTHRSSRPQEHLLMWEGATVQWCLSASELIFGCSKFF